MMHQNDPDFANQQAQEDELRNEAIKQAYGIKDDLLLAFDDFKEILSIYNAVQLRIYQGLPMA